MNFLIHQIMDSYVGSKTIQELCDILSTEIKPYTFKHISDGLFEIYENSDNVYSFTYPPENAYILSVGDFVYLSGDDIEVCCQIDDIDEKMISLFIINGDWDGTYNIETNMLYPDVYPEKTRFVKNITKIISLVSHKPTIFDDDIPF